MKFGESLEIVCEDSKKMAVPVNGNAVYPFGIYFDRYLGWLWSNGKKAGIPTPVLLKGNWEVMERGENEN